MEPECLSLAWQSFSAFAGEGATALRASESTETRWQPWRSRASATYVVLFWLTKFLAMRFG